MTHVKRLPIPCLTTALVTVTGVTLLDHQLSIISMPCWIMVIVLFASILVSCCLLLSITVDASLQQPLIAMVTIDDD